MAIVETQTESTAESEDARESLHSSFARDDLVGADFLFPRQERRRNDELVVLNLQVGTKRLDEQSGYEACPK